MKIDLRNINKTLNEGLSGWDSTHTLKVSREGFEPKHTVHAGRNEVSKLVDYSKTLIEADSIYIMKPFKDSPSYYRVLIGSRVKNNHGFGNDYSYYFRVKLNGKYYDLYLKEDWDLENCNVNRLKNLFGYELSSLKEKFEGSNTEPIKSLRQLTEDYYQRFVKFSMDRESDCEEFFKSVGASMVRRFKYFKCVSFSADYVKVLRNGVEFGFKTNDTYCSLPVIIKIERVRQIKTVRLRDIGLEESGYYSHSDNLEILPEQVEAVKRFKKRFDRNKKQVIEQVLKEVKSA